MDDSDTTCKMHDTLVMLHDFDNMKVAASCFRQGHDILAVPALAGKRVVLKYNAKGNLLGSFSEKQLMTLQRCKVPQKIGTSRVLTFAQVPITELHVHLRFICGQMIATDATTSSGKIVNRLTTLNVLSMMGFKTLLGLVCWIPPTKSKSMMEAVLRETLDKVNTALESGKTLWSTGGQDLRVRNLPPFTKLGLVDAIGFKPESTDPKIVSILKDIRAA